MSTRRAAERLGALPLGRVAETVFTLFVLYCLSGGPLPAEQSTGDPQSGNPRLQAMLVGFYFLALALTLKRPGARWRAVNSDIALLALLGWIVASAVWSVEPGVSLVRAMALVGTSCFGIYFAVRYPLESQLRLLGTSFGIIVIYNVCLAVMQPGITLGGFFSGGFYHKNELGKMMTLATVVFLCMAAERRWRMPAMIAGSLSFALLVISGSATSLVVALTLVGVFPLLRLVKEDARLLVVLAIAGLLVLGMGVLLAPQAVAVVAPALGRDATLTGRTELWPFLLEMILRRPWLGYGYSAFWLDDSELNIGWQPSQAHNGFLEVALGLGLVGFLVFAFVCIRGIVRAVLLMRRERTPASYWPLMYLSFVLLYNLTESTVLARNNIHCILFVSVLITVSPAWLQPRGAQERIRRAREPGQRGYGAATAGIQRGPVATTDST